MRTSRPNVHIHAVLMEESNAGKKKWDRASKAQAIGWVEEWMKLMLLDRLHVDVNFSSTSKSDDDHTVGVGAAAVSRANDPYLNHWKVTFYPSYLDHDDDGREQFVVHELSHFLVGYLRECFRILSSDKLVTWAEWKRTEETAVDHIANILVALSRRS